MEYHLIGLVAFKGEREKERDLSQYLHTQGRPLEDRVRGQLPQRELGPAASRPLRSKCLLLKPPTIKATQADGDSDLTA